MQRQTTLTGNIDWFTLLLYVALVLIGWATIYSAVYTEEQTSIFDTAYNSGRQFQWMIACAIIGFMLLLIDSRFYSTMSYIIYGATCLLLVGVLLFGVEVKGDKAWIRLGGFQMQPSELAKAATALALAKFLSTLNVDIRRWHDKWRAFAIIAVPMLLTILQGDAGSAIVFAVFVLAMFREGLESYFLVAGVSVAAIGLLALVANKFVLMGIFAGFVVLIAYFNFRNRRLVFWSVGVAIVASSMVWAVDFAFNKLEKHQQDRINVLLGKGGNDWNIRQSLIAIGSGGLTGKGYLNGTQTKLKFVPEQSTDFIFSSIGEEFGFAGSVGLIALYLLLLFRLLFMAERQRSKFSRVYGYCVASVLFVHFTVNMGMAIGVVPVIGIPLPFISYGGSSLLAFTVLLFIFIRLDAQRMEMLR